MVITNGTSTFDEAAMMATESAPPGLVARYAVKGSIPARQDANPALYDTYLKWSLKQWKADKLACSITHGCAVSNAWNAAIDTAIGQFMSSKDVAAFQKALVAAHAKNA